MAHGRASPLTAHTVLHVDSRVCDHGEEEVSFTFVLDLHDGWLVALQQYGLYPSGDARPDAKAFYKVSIIRRQLYWQVNKLTTSRTK